MRILRLLLIGGLLLSGFAVASAITYTEGATATGTLGNTSFTNASLVFTFTGNTSNVTGGVGFFSIVATGATLRINGGGAITITDSGIRVAVNQGFAPPAAGFGGAQGSILDTLDNAFGTYALVTAIGPITDTSFIRPDLTFATSSGGLNITSAGNSTFTATTTPEPATLMTLGAGLLAFGAHRYRQTIRRS
ncbi:MAG TPA: PEP-CTERM sorting domain-containing protein [Bryobacteraceae bacterium]|nr:PEP-CTERM sorting domain-containing protein [Bryobacteraceae bacterium]